MCDVPDSSLSDAGSETDDSSDSEQPERTFAFPDLDTQIRAVVTKYDGAVFPKLNWTSPQDASWILSPSTPLRCTSPSDVYLYLKSSDFASHDLDPEMVFDGCVDYTKAESNDESNVAQPLPYDLELVLKKWYGMDRSREMRCFVRNNTLIGICQRDVNFYPYLTDKETRDKITNSIRTLWESKINGVFQGSDSYIFDVLLTRSLGSANLVDFNPYAPRTDALLFTYAELLALYLSQSQVVGPELRVIDSAGHPLASRNAPANQHNMVPREALELSQGRSMEEFGETWIHQIRAAMETDQAAS